MDLVKIVDENGDLTGIVFDKTEACAKNLIQNEVVVFVGNNNNQILLQKRSKNKKYYPNKWALCTGHVEKNENEYEAAIRELKEELGLEVRKHELQKIDEDEWTLREKNTHVTYFFYMKIDKKESEFTIQESELSEVKWYDIDTIITNIINKDDSIVIPYKRLKLIRTLKNKNSI